MNVSNCSAYELIEESKISDLNSIGYLLRHKKSGARVAVLENDDENKVFNIGFRTPPRIRQELPILSSIRCYAVRISFL